MNRLNHRQRILIGVGVAVMLVIVAIVAYASSGRNNGTTEDTVKPAISIDDSRWQRVFIKDFSKWQASIDIATQRSVENRLYSNTVVINKKPVELYTGVMREGSYSETGSGDRKNIMFLVDVELADLTFRVDINKYRTFRSVYLSCAPKAQQMDPAAICIEGVA